MKIKHLLRFGLMSLLLTSANNCMAEASKNSSESSCTRLIEESSKVELYEVRSIYRFLAVLDSAGCSVLTRDALDFIVENGDLNLVSYSIFENRTSDIDVALAPDLIADYVGSQISAGNGVNQELLLTLTDIFFDTCSGKEECVGEMISKTIGDSHLKKDALCFFGMAHACRADEIEQTVILNQTTITRLPVALNADAMRREFICARYGYCKPNNDTGEADATRSP
jgi:hypothetical protein